MQGGRKKNILSSPIESMMFCWPEGISPTVLLRGATLFWLLHTYLACPGMGPRICGPGFGCQEKMIQASAEGESHTWARGNEGIPPYHTYVHLPKKATPPKLAIWSFAHRFKKIPNFSDKREFPPVTFCLANKKFAHLGHIIGFFQVKYHLCFVGTFFCPPTIYFKIIHATYKKYLP